VFQLDQVVPWGRSFDEYCRMFALSDQDLTLRILGCGDGPASFNAEATRRGSKVISCDPIYRWEAADIRNRIAATRDQILEQARQNADDYVWSSIGSVDELDRIRMAAMNTFLEDFPNGKAQGRYVEGGLPTLPFADRSFDLALCSHLLFLYSDQLGEAFHRHATRELCRVAREIRIFPLLALNWKRSPFIDGAMADLRGAGHDVSIEKVLYEFQRGGNQMMRILSRAGAAT
jgi:SAM-dependent methyltransferase